MTTPRNFLAWVFASAIALLICLVFIFLILDLYHGNFPRFAALASVPTPLGQALIVASVAAVVATVIVIILAATRGNLEFSALGVSFKGPSGPLLLWTAVFLAIAAVLLASLTASAPGKATIDKAGDYFDPKVVPFNTGWIFTGYYTKAQGFLEGPYAPVVFRPGSDERGAIMPKLGDILQIRKPRRVIIAGYRFSGLANQILRASITTDDETGVVLEKGKLLLVRDVVLNQYPGRPYSIWCRVAECDRGTDSCVKAAAELEGG